MSVQQLLLVLMLLAAIGLIGPTYLSRSRTALGTNPASTPSATATYDGEALVLTAQAIRTALPTFTLVPGWPPEKIRGLQGQELTSMAMATAKALYPPPPDWPPLPTRITEPTLPTPIPVETRTADGAITDKQANGPPCTMQYNTNLWHGQVGGQTGEVYTEVCAGANKLDKTLGELVIRVGTHDPDKPVQVVNYLTPGHTGFLRIVGEAGGRLTLQAQDGALVYFDLVGREWVPAPVTPSPSVSPFPSVTP